MNLLCDDLLKMILSFLQCNSNICLVNKRLFNEFSCKIISLPILERKVCDKCDKHILSIENLLNRETNILESQNYISSIHFNSKEDLLIAEHIFHKFGIVSHQYIVYILYRYLDV